MAQQIILALGVAKANTLNCSLKTNLPFLHLESLVGLSLVKGHLWCCHWSNFICGVVTGQRSLLHACHMTLGILQTD